MLRTPANIEIIHTLGPSGTNCETAAAFWYSANGLEGEVVLHDTLEDAVGAVEASHKKSALLGCIVYPELHTLVFSNLDTLYLDDVFVMPTHNMVLASRDGQNPTTVLSHPAPRKLAPAEASVRLVNSNSRAAMDCAGGLSDGCVTTLVAAKREGLTVIKDYGPVPMGFSIHRRLKDLPAAGCGARNVPTRESELTDA